MRSASAACTLVSACRLAVAEGGPLLPRAMPSGTDEAAAASGLLPFAWTDDGPTASVIFLSWTCASFIVAVASRMRCIWLPKVSICSPAAAKLEMRGPMASSVSTYESTSMVDSRSRTSYASSFRERGVPGSVGASSLFDKPGIAGRSGIASGAVEKENNICFRVQRNPQCCARALCPPDGSALCLPT